ncbi:sensor domain-containing diguanylate cyclase [Luteimonas saliphila]|uniref:sensor domain-containing diguanylate cyclase n=1 Tax=Luteimonas saliphila TaxID=2804919 RepID=UPI00192E202E|nr:sensor domain-containing diguanylate cyclase [Luteimonas saliphila]
MPNDSIAGETRARNLQFVRRIHGMRMLGTLLSALPIASVLDERGAPPWAWALLALNALAWPQIASHASRRARDPVAAQFRCLALDSASAGAWVAAIAVSTAPAALFVTMATADKIAAGGWPFVRRSTLALLGAFLLVWTLMGFPFQPITSQRTLLLCIPFMFVYAVVLSVVTHRLRSRILAQNRELERLNRTDPAMQVPNRPHFEAVASMELARFRRSGRPATLLLLDVDNFKTINDRYGHGMGDIVLKRIADLLRVSVREADLPARYGGDEFAVLLVDTDTARALQVAERIRQEAAQQTFDAEPGLRCTLSIGVAQATADDATLDAWVRAADGALYRAKAAGRDRVVAA